MSPPLLLLLILVPIMVADANLNSLECYSELVKIHKCAKNNSIFLLDKVHQIILSNDWALSRQLAGIPGMYFCMGDMNCPTSRKYHRYLKDHEWILIQWHGALKKCLIDADLVDQLVGFCHALLNVFGPVPYSESCDSYILSKVPCTLAKLEKHPKECPSETRRLFEQVMRNINANCQREFELRYAFEAVGINPFDL